MKIKPILITLVIVCAIFAIVGLISNVNSPAFQSENEMFEIIDSFIETLLDRPIKIKEYYYNDKLYKRTLNQQDKKGVWKTIGSSKKFLIIFKKKNIRISEKIFNKF